MFTINLNQNVINQLFELHENPVAELSNETVAALDLIEMEHGPVSPVSALDGSITFEIL